MLLSFLVCAQHHRWAGKAGAERLSERAAVSLWRHFPLKRVNSLPWHSWDVYQFPTNIQRKHIKKILSREKCHAPTCAGHVLTAIPKNLEEGEWCGYHACLGRKTIALPHSHSASIWKSLIGTVRDCPCLECPCWCVCRTHLASISKQGGEKKDLIFWRFTNPKGN